MLAGNDIQQFGDFHRVDTAFKDEPDVFPGVLVNNVAHLKRFTPVVGIELGNPAPTHHQDTARAAPWGVGSGSVLRFLRLRGITRSPS